MFCCCCGHRYKSINFVSTQLFSPRHPPSKLGSALGLSKTVVGTLVFRLRFGPDGVGPAASGFRKSWLASFSTPSAAPNWLGGCTRFFFGSRRSLLFLPRPLPTDSAPRLSEKIVRFFLPSASSPSQVRRPPDFQKRASSRIFSCLGLFLRIRHPAFGKRSFASLLPRHLPQVRFDGPRIFRNGRSRASFPASAPSQRVRPLGCLKTGVCGRPPLERQAAGGGRCRKARRAALGQPQRCGGGTRRSESPMPGFTLRPMRMRRYRKVSEAVQRPDVLSTPHRPVRQPHVPPTSRRPAPLPPASVPEASPFPAGPELPNRGARTARTALGDPSRLRKERRLRDPTPRDSPEPLRCGDPPAEKRTQGAFGAYRRKKRGTTNRRPVFRPRKGIELTARGGSPIPYRSGLRVAGKDYFSSTSAPASSSWPLIDSASSFETPSFTAFGAPSTRALASPSDRPAISFTALITWSLA